MSLRNKVLCAFRKLHRARKDVFRDDDNGLSKARQKINEEFRKHLTEMDSSKITELIQIAEDAERLLRQMIVQAELRPDGVYELRITKDTHMEDNTIFDEQARLPVEGKGPTCRSDKPS